MGLNFWHSAVAQTLTEKYFLFFFFVVAESIAWTICTMRVLCLHTLVGVRWDQASSTIRDKNVMHFVQILLCSMEFYISPSNTIRTLPNWGDSNWMSLRLSGDQRLIWHTQINGGSWIYSDYYKENYMAGVTGDFHRSFGLRNLDKAWLSREVKWEDKWQGP